MRAALVLPDPNGGRLEIRTVETPKAAPGLVLVRVKASGVNRGEVFYRRAALKGEPFVGGVEFAGEVAALGDGVAGLSVGQRVMGHGAATQADYVLVEPRALMPVPANLGWAEAAAFPNVFITAHDAMVTAGGFRPGESVLINAAASGIGTAAIQIAKALGAKIVIGTSRNRAKLQKAASLGLTHCIVVPEEPLGPAVAAATARGSRLGRMSGSTVQHLASAISVVRPPRKRCRCESPQSCQGVRSSVRKSPAKPRFTPARKSADPARENHPSGKEQKV